MSVCTSRGRRHLLTLLLIAAAGCKAGNLSTPAAWDRTEVEETTPLSSAEAVPPLTKALPQAPLPRIVGTAETSEVWSLPLREAMSIALRNSDIIRTLQSGNALVSPGTNTLPSGTVVASPVTNYDPGILEAQYRAAIAAFDPVFNAGYVGSRISQAPGTFFGPGINLSTTTRRDEGNLIATVVKPWTTGGTTTIAYNPSTGYVFYPNGSSGFNPRFSGNVELSLRQPLLRGFGMPVNTVPIRIAQLQKDQSIWDVKQFTLGLVRSVEEVYWQLQAAHVALHAVDEILPLIDEVVRDQQAIDDEGRPEADLTKAQSQQAAFREQRIAARATVIQKELQLRNLLGLEPVDERVIVPVDAPIRAPVYINAPDAIAAALKYRPDLMRQRLSVRIRELQLLVARNGLKPQLDATALYRMNGVGQNVGDMLEQLNSHDFTDWTLGMTYSRPIGNRVPQATAQSAELQLDKESALFRQNVHAVAHNLADILRQIAAARDQCALVRSRVEQTEIWFAGSRLRYEDPPAALTGNKSPLLAMLNDYLSALQSKVQATTEAGALFAQYNVLLARLEEAMGTLLDAFQIQLQNDPAHSPAAGIWPVSGWYDIQPTTWKMAEEPLRGDRAPAALE